MPHALLCTPKRSALITNLLRRCLKHFEQYRWALGSKLDLAGAHRCSPQAGHLHQIYVLGHWPMSLPLIFSPTSGIRLLAQPNRVFRHSPRTAHNQNPPHIETVASARKMMASVLVSAKAALKKNIVTTVKTGRIRFILCFTKSP